MSDWVPTREAWDKFLSLLDANEEIAGQRYENIRKRLIVYFDCRKCRAAEDMADETIVRVIRRNYEGVHIEDPVRYSYGVARMVRLEGTVATQREDSIKDELLRSGAAFGEPKYPDEHDQR